MGIFDSGVGGLSVLRELRVCAPSEDIVYFGDTKNAPYGEKSERELSMLVSRALDVLFAEGAESILSACNSTSALAVAQGRRGGNVPVVEMICPTVEELCARNGRIAVLATPATIRSGMYQREFLKRRRSADFVAVPDLAGAIESDAPEKHIEEIVRRSLIAAMSCRPAVISLSCTHFPLVADYFIAARDNLGYDVEIFDPSRAAARAAAERARGEETGKVRFLITKESAVFRRIVREMLLDDCGTVSVIS